MMTGKRLAAFVIVCLALHGAVGRADVWTDLAAYKMGDTSNAPGQLENLVRDTAPDKYAPIEKNLIALVTSKSATPAGKRYACRMLQRVGTDAAVPALNGLLGDDSLAHYARLALQRMEKSAAAGAALRGALAKASDKTKPGIIASLAERGDKKALALISPMVSDKNADVAAAAMKALGKLGGAQSAAALSRASAPKEIEAVRVDALLTCADSLPDRQAAAIFKSIYSRKNSDIHRVAALEGMVRTDDPAASRIVTGLIKGKDSYLRRGAMRLVVMTPSKKLTAAVAATLRTLSTAKRAEVIAALAQRRDRTAVKRIMPYLASKNDSVRESAIIAVGALGDATCVKLLLKQAAAGGVGAKAQDALARMNVEGVDKALAAMLTDKTLRVEAIKALSARGGFSASKAMLKMIKDKDPNVRKEAWVTLAQIATEDSVGVMMEGLIAAKSTDEKKQAEKAVRTAFAASGDRKQACFKAAAKHYDKADDATKALILDLAAISADNEALNIAKGALKSSNKTLHDKAVRSLSAWTNLNAASTLLDLAKNASDATERLLALRGYIRMAGMPWNRRSRNEAKERVSMYRMAAGLAKDAGAKKQIISGLGSIKRLREIDALKLLDGYLADPAVKAEAEIVIIDVANECKRSNRKEVAAVAKKLMDTSKNRRIVSSAKKLYGETKQK